MVVEKIIYSCYGDEVRTPNAVTSFQYTDA